MQACCVNKSQTPFVEFVAICGNLYTEGFASGEQLEGVAADRSTCNDAECN